MYTVRQSESGTAVALGVEVLAGTWLALEVICIMTELGHRGVG